MDDTYQFAESSLPLLDKCIKAAGLPAREWMALFQQSARLEQSEHLKKEGASSSASTERIDYEDILEEHLNKEGALSSASIEKVIYKKVLEEHLNKEGALSRASIEKVGCKDVLETGTEDMPRQATAEEIENIRANLEMEPNKIDYLMKQCDNYDNVLPILAGKLSSKCVELICSECFNNRPSFIEKFYVEFLSVYLKRESFNTLELLIRAREAHPEAFKSLIVILLSSSASIPVLNFFFTTIDSVEISEILQALSMTQLSSEAFIQHLNAISSLYKKSEKTVEIQHFILNCLIHSAEACSKDRGYGRFLLTYLQSLKESDALINKYELEQLVNIHNTPFVKPSLTILKNYR